MADRNAGRIARERAERKGEWSERKREWKERRARRAERMARRSTFVIVLSDLCEKYKLEKPVYQDLRENVHDNRIFWIGLTRPEFGFSVKGSSLVSKEEAKEEAAHKVMLELRKAVRLGRTLNVSNHKLRLYCSWMYTVPLMNEDFPNVSNGALQIWLEDRGSPLPVYKLASIFQTSDPPHQVYWFSCKFSDGNGERLTIGEGKTIKIAKNVAARIMFQLLQTEAE